MSVRYSFFVPGPPTGKGRPRFVRATGRAYTPRDTELAQQRVLHAWQNTGRARIDTAAVSMDVIAEFARPRSHYLSDGALSATGRRSPYPAKRPDIDNLVKLVCDALNGHAYRDDAQIVDLVVAKTWAHREGIQVTLAERSAASSTWVRSA